MCFHKSFAKSEQDLLDHYQASFDSIRSELDVMTEKFQALLGRDGRLNELTRARPDALFEVLTQYDDRPY